MPAEKKAERLCEIAECGKKHWAKGRCENHYYQLWRADNPEKATASRLRNREGHRSALYKWKYGLTLLQVLELLSSQGGACAICSAPIDRMGPGRGEGHLDHCHRTGKVRGVLCSGCNKGLGFLELHLEPAHQYLRKAGLK